MTDAITCDVCPASSDWVCRRCYDALELKVQLLERALADVCKAADKITRWDFSPISVAHPDSQAIIDDIAALFDALKSAKGTQP